MKIDWHQSSIQLVVTLLSIVLLASCSTSKLPKPEVTLSNVQLDSVGLFETSMLVTLRVANESGESLAIDGSVHKLYFNDIYIGKALSDRRLVIPRLSSITEEMTLEISNLALGTNLQRMLQSRGMRYRIESSFYVDGLLAGKVNSVREDTLWDPRRFRSAV